jgi:hypothetical protein
MRDSGRAPEKTSNCCGGRSHCISTSAGSSTYSTPLAAHAHAHAAGPGHARPALLQLGQQGLRMRGE